MAILTQEYQVEICVINTESGGRIDHFGEDKHFPYRVFLLYDNLHYDPGKRKSSRERNFQRIACLLIFVLVYLVTCDILEEKEFVQTKFSRDNENVLSLAKNLVNKE